MQDKVFYMPHVMPPNRSPQDETERLLQVILDAHHSLDEHLDLHPRSLDNIRWVAREGELGCKGAAVVVALIEKRASRLKARVLNNKLKGSL